jgi:hypothetical protein
MRVFRILVLLPGLTGLPLGGVAFLTALQVNDIVEKTRAEPNVLRAAELLDKGSPENLHVEVTDFKFGSPVIATNKDGWQHAWLPIQPALQSKNAKKTAKNKIFYRAKVQDQASLNEFVKRTKLAALVTTPLPEGSRWRVTFDQALRKAYPDQDSRQTVFLAEPRMTFLDYAIELSDARLYDVGYQSLVAWGATGLVLVGFLSLYKLIARRGSAARSRQPVGLTDPEAQRATLLTERPESLHDAKGSYILGGVCMFGTLAGFLLLLGAGGILAVVKNQMDGKPLLAVLAGFFVVALFLGATSAMSACRQRRRWPTDIAVCFSGLRWRQGRTQRAILWAEVEDIDRNVKLVPRANYVGGVLGAMAQLNNPQPPIRIDTLKITLRSGESYRMSPSTITDYPKFATEVGKLWGDDVKNSDCTGVTEAWMIARGLRTEKTV